MTLQKIRPPIIARLEDTGSQEFSAEELPLRAELFSADQMEQHGKVLASLHKVAFGRTSEHLLARLAENEQVLTYACNLLAEAVNANRRITSAGEWLLDNFYLIEEQIRTAKKHFPKGYSRELPHLVNGVSAGLPRVYDIALYNVSHGDGKLDPTSLERFVGSYQTVSELKIGELWAIPIMLRLALIENLRRVAVRMVVHMNEHSQAGIWADKMIDTATTDPKSLILVIADMARSNPPMVSAFVSELARKLQGQSSALALGLTWMEQRLAESSTTIEQMVQAEAQIQAADQVSISNSIGSLRFLGAIDWRKFVEAQSVVEKTLLGDPAGAYEKMDFSTRDDYRHVVEKLSKKSKMSEREIAQSAISLAENAGQSSVRAKHVGYYLIDDGLSALENAVAVKFSFVDLCRMLARKFSLLAYLAPILLITLTVTSGLAYLAHFYGSSRLLTVFIACATLIASSQLAVSLVNWIATILIPSKPLPKLDFSEGIPKNEKTLVIVPTMISSVSNIEGLIESLEVRFLANRDEHLHFALLTDFLDAPSEVVAQDEFLVGFAAKKIDELNQKYKTNSRDIFFLFHRPRLFNESEGVWMGYERKRGKLAALNSVLLGGSQACFSKIVGDLSVLSGTKFVITLDTDTQLPRDAARQFVGAMMHPLNRPQFDEEKKLVVSGYGILQPRVGVSLPGTNLSRYAALHGNDAGIDPYTRAVSDVYQDLFREGSFIGKGIYDVEMFEKALCDRFPENRILSHDLLEGCYVRSGLLSDVQLYEEYPSGYIADVARRHRWIRGDWQILSWLGAEVPVSHKRKQKNPLSFLSQWKIFDNLRRSLVPSALTVMLIVGWTSLTPAWIWTCAALAVALIPSLLASLLDLIRKPEDVLWKQHTTASVNSASRNLGQAMFNFACLPYEAVYSLDAITRTLVRMVFTKKHLLAWNPSNEANRRQPRDLVGIYTQMSSGPMVAAGVFAYLVLERPTAIIVALPIVLLWSLSPVIAWWLSRPISSPAAKLTEEQLVFLRRIARRTWAFFETFITAEDHWLPPDNMQELPIHVVAHRTSPTNMGLSLLANLGAYDFGYIQLGELVERTYSTLVTMRALDRYRGHLYNWYDTITLKPLKPLYISTVDSGNLGGHLVTLKAGLLELLDEPIIPSQAFSGLRDTLDVLRQEVAETVVVPQFSIFEDLLDAAMTEPPTSISSLNECLEALQKCAQEIVARLGDTAGSEAKAWAQALKRQTSAACMELTLLIPWISLPGLGVVSASIPHVERIPTLRELTRLYADLMPIIQQSCTADRPMTELKTLTELLALFSEASRRAQERIGIVNQLVMHIEELSYMEYDFLYDKNKRLLSIGYNADEKRVDASYYDLLASEARLCNFVAIAQGQLPQESWFALGRSLTTAGGNPVLFSWSGSMFEYLMPLLVMPNFKNTLLDQTYLATVNRQIEYGKQRNVPWGISESGYFAVDAHLNYQYRAFGVPGLGLKRGLAQDLVIAPYATVMALMVAPEEACANMQRLAEEGFSGSYGFYEAVDYTASRIPRGHSRAVIQSYMAHHQGMSFLSLLHVLHDQPMQRRFESDPSFQSTILLLQERIPKATAFHSQTAETAEVRFGSVADEAPVRFFSSPNTAVPEIQLLSNGRYHVMITNSGGGYSRWKERAITRWREDTTRDHWGTFCFIRDVSTGEFWSSAYQPTLKQPERYEAIFSEARVEFRRRDFDFDTHTEIVVSSEDDIELRRVRITNRSRSRKTIDVTSYAEVVLADPAHDNAHPAFSNLFVQTELIEQGQAILCTRRPRSDSESQSWMFHLMSVHGAAIGDVSRETDRMKFIGRGNSLTNPAAMKTPGGLSNSQGSVLDPIVSVRHQIVLDPEKSVTVNIVTGVTETRDACISLVEKYQDKGLADRVFDLAWTHSQVVLRQLNANESDGQLYARLANSVVYANSSLRADPSVIIKNLRGQSDLWGYAISGDLPIVLLQIKDPNNIDLVRQVVHAHAYWRLKGLPVDLVIWNEDKAGYRQLIQDQIMGMIAGGVEASLIDKPGGIFVRQIEQISIEDRILIQTVARVIIKDSNGALPEQLNRRSIREVRVPPLSPLRTRQVENISAPPMQRSDLMFFNGAGGFTLDGREYVIVTGQNHVTPLPWVNVLANPYFGSVISENGLSYTWLENAHEFRLTPWNNDPVTDESGEAFYLRDEETGYFWSPTPMPVCGANPYTTRHGFGYSVFEHTEGGITTELCVYVVLDAPVKIAALKVRNNSGRPRKLSATAYFEWVFGDMKPKTVMHITTEVDTKTGALLARNRYNREFGERIAFVDVDENNRAVTGDRAEFLGRNGSLRNPAALSRQKLSGKVGAALDPCGAVQVPFELQDGEEREITFRLGIGQDMADTTNLINRFRGSRARLDSYEALCQYWKHTLGAVNVQTPDPALNMLANGWLLYQTIACRLWARSGYYQSGGAFGYRDQLQDAMALVHTEPLLLRKQLLLCASRQFVEGDVQHWWHPPTGRGVRTRISDDYLWLPLATCRYVMMTGDTGVLDEQAHFLTGRPVNPQDDSYYDLPGRSQETASLYEHCQKAILNGLKFGVHGLPLMGTGDWNDGMNLVGDRGKGESVWLGFFLHEVLRRFIKLARMRKDDAFAERCEAEAAQLRQHLAKSGWDGDWYRRAYFDDGTPLGSSKNEECQIDSISQSWSILSGGGEIERSKKGMNSAYERLVRHDSALIQLLDPPFDKSELNPGYIKGYVPGVRENGGQYTHAAIWLTMAFAALGDSRRAWQLFTMINPVNHALNPNSMRTYMAEPYVVAADVYGVAPHTGRGGWTWYTGSASWMYRLIIESILGIRLQVDKLRFQPCLPAEWSEYKIHYRYRETVFHITVLQRSDSDGHQTVTVDGVEQPDGVVSLVDDRREHNVVVSIGRSQERTFAAMTSNLPVIDPQ